jgi:UDP-GlcNAc:undecaprenyl-phosphate GlcNAc-1-phosphate transferase
MAKPVKERWHKRPTALLGGIAIYVGMAVPLFLTTDFTTLILYAHQYPNHPAPPSVGAVVWIGVSFLFILGLLDDCIDLKPHTKLVGQILVASMAAFLGFRLHWFVSLTLDTMVTIFWVVGITNAFNLIDNMDGLCAGVGAICALMLALIFYGYSSEAVHVALILAGALGAFLIYNFNPASIFMGDCGSLGIGFTLAMLSLFYSEAGAPNAVAVYVVPVMVLVVPLMDTTMVTLIRLLSGRKASVGGSDHTSHRLVLMGLNEKNAVVFLLCIGLVSGLAALFVSRTDTLTSPSVIIPVAVSCLLMGVYLAQIRVYTKKEFSLLRGKVYTPILLELTYKRQIILVLLDLGLIAFSYYLSYRLRFDDKDFVYYFKVFSKSLPAVIACKFIAFFGLKIYRSIWSYTSTTDVLGYLKASTIATLLSLSAVVCLFGLQCFPKGIFLIDWLLTTGFILGTRGSFRFFLETLKRRTLSGSSVIIYGAGRGGEILVREILNNKQLNMKPVCFVDDDNLKIGKKLQGLSISGGFSDLDVLCKKYSVNGLLISFRMKNADKLLEIKRQCRQNKLFLKRFSICFEDIDT